MYTDGPKDGPTDGPTDGRTVGRTDGQTDRPIQQFIPHADHRGGIGRTPVQINNYPVCMITKSYFRWRSAHASISIIPG